MSAQRSSTDAKPTIASSRPTVVSSLSGAISPLQRCGHPLPAGFPATRYQSTLQRRGLDQNIWRTYNRRPFLKTCATGISSMPDIVVDSPAPTCSHLNSKSRIQGSQPLGIDPSPARARVSRARGFAKGKSGNPRGRPRGIRNPRRRVPDLTARPLSAQALSDLLDRKPHLLRPLAVQLLPPPLKPIDPADRLGIDLSPLHTAEDLRELLPKVLAAIARGENHARRGRASRTAGAHPVARDPPPRTISAPPGAWHGSPLG